MISYTYDTWGKLVSIKIANGTDVTNDSTSIGNINPNRYRGYRFDAETGMYYLQSRYYNCEFGRFINADNLDVLDEDQDSLLENKLFAYCLNNPVNMSDSDGEIAWWIAAAVGGVVFDSILYTAGAGATGNFRLSGLGKTAVTGAITGLALGGVGKIATKVVKVAAKAIKATKIVKTTKLLNSAQNLKKAETIINFTKATAKHMKEYGRYVPVQTLRDAIDHGIAKADPRGTKAIMYYMNMYRNGKKYKLEVLYDHATKTILHFMYK